MSPKAPSRALAYAAALACGCHTFRPVAPLHGGDRDTELEAVAMRVPGPPFGEEAVLTLEVLRTARRRLAEARLATGAEPECQGGTAARSVLLRGASGQGLPTRTLAGEARSVDLAFGREDLTEALGREPAFVDLRLLPEENRTILGVSGAGKTTEKKGAVFRGVRNENPALSPKEKGRRCLRGTS